MNVNRLKGKIVEQGLNIPIVAEKIGVDRATLYRKLNNEGATMTIKEAQNIVEVLNLDAKEATLIFFTDHVASDAK